MKKFTKIILIIAGSLAALGIVFSGIAAVWEPDGQPSTESTCR